MKKFVVITLLSVASVLVAFAETLLVEDFQYAIGKSVTNDSSAWFLPYGGSSVYSITNGLSFSGYAGCGVGNAVLLDQKVSNDHPHLSFDEQTSGSVYVAFMFQPTIVPKAGYFFALRDQVAGNTTFNYNGRIFVNDSYQLGLAFANTQLAEYSSLVLNSQKVYLVVLRYDIVSGANNDVVSLYLFSEGEPIPTSEPASPLIGPLSDSNKVDINPANVVLRGYDNDGWLVIDGIRVATSFSEAVLPGVCPGEEAALESISNDDSRGVIILEDGMLYIEYQGVRYSMMGARL